MTEPVVIEGTVVHGRQLGRRLGFPTANLAVPDALEARDGVYLSEAEVDGQLYGAMSNLGRNPSVGGTERRLESYLFGFEGELYGRQLRIRLLRRLREERKLHRSKSCSARLRPTAARPKPSLPHGRRSGEQQEQQERQGSERLDERPGSERRSENGRSVGRS